MLFLNGEDLKRCCDLDDLRATMRESLLSYSLKRTSDFPRTVFTLNNDYQNALGFMPAADFNGALLGYKAITVFHQNNQNQLNPHQGIVVLLNEKTGQVKSILDGGFLTAVRTAAVSAVATELLSRPNARTLALIGSGRQALEHIHAIGRIRPLETICVYTRNRDSFNQLQQLVGQEFILTAVTTPQAAVANADIIVTCTSSKEYLLDISDIKEGAHVNAIGASRPNDYELRLHDRSYLKIYLDSQTSCFNESDEIIQPIKNKSLSKHRIIGELGECLADRIPGRTHEQEITVFKSVGLSIEDVYAAECLYQNANKTNIGQSVQL